MFRKLRAALFAALCLLAPSGLAHAEPAAPPPPGRFAVVVAPILVDPPIQGRLPAAYSAEVLRREFEIALESTGLFTVPTRDKRELDQVLTEMVRTGRRSARAIPGQYIISTTLMAADLGERRRPAPHMRDRDLASVSGSLALRVTVLRASDAGVKTRMSLDVTYAGKDRLTDPIGDGNLGRFNAQTNPGSPADFVALSQAAGRALAKRVLDQVSPVVVIQRTGDQLWLSRGEDAGYTIGEVLRVMKVGAELRDQRTGEVLDRADVQIGEAKVVEVRPRVTVAQIVRSTEDITSGAIVREPVDIEQ